MMAVQPSEVDVIPMPAQISVMLTLRENRKRGFVAAKWTGVNSIGAAMPTDSYSAIGEAEADLTVDASWLVTEMAAADVIAKCVNIVYRIVRNRWRR